MKTNRWLAFSVLLVPLAVSAASHSSANYSVPADVVDAGGRRVTSAAYSNDGSMGGFGGVSVVNAPSGTVKHGYPAQLFEVVSVAVVADPATVNETSTRQLSAGLSYDDATVTPLAPASIAWSVVSGPLSGISAGGLVTAANVYQDTPAVVRGTSGAYSNTAGLLVINTGIDDFASYAADGIDDAWQVQYFGVGNPNAGPGFDPDGDGQTNFFEYVATTIPTDPSSKFRLNIAPVPSRPWMNLIFSPISVRRDYTVEARPLVNAGVFDTVPGDIVDNGTERTLTDTNALSSPKYYRIKIEFP